MSKLEKGRSTVKLHIKNWSGSELKADFEMDETKAREVSRALYVAQTGNCRTEDLQLAALVRESGTSISSEIAHRLEWLSGINRLLSIEVQELQNQIADMRKKDDLQKLEVTQCD